MNKTDHSEFDITRRRRLPRWLGPALGALVLLALGWLIWRFISDQSGVRREAPNVPTIIPLPPPPPPPPKPPEPEKKVEEKLVEPESKPMEPVTPKLDAPPKPADLSDPMTMDTDAQAGGDAFNIGSGSGSGMGMGSPGGGRAGTGTYGQYLAYALQRVLQQDDRTRRLIFRMSVDIWLDPSGKPTQVQLVQSSGNADTDAAVLATLRAIDRLEERPTPGLVFPARVVITGRRSS